MADGKMLIGGYWGQCNRADRQWITLLFKKLSTDSLNNLVDKWYFCLVNQARFRCGNF